MFSPGGRRQNQDKLSRANAVAPMLESGMVWYPEGMECCEDLVEECAAFPNGNNDDQVDVTTMALQRFRQGNFIALDTDDQDEGDPRHLAEVEYY
jgi:predicted phage terminase large subunit-like protein